MMGKERDQEKNQGCRKKILWSFTKGNPIAAAPGPGLGREKGGQTDDACCQEQARVSGIGKKKGKERPDQKGIGRGGNIEDLAEHGKVEDKTGKADQTEELGEIAGLFPLRGVESACQTKQGGCDEDNNLNGGRESAPELIEEEKDTGRKSERTQEGGDFHPQAELLFPSVDINIKGRGQLGQEILVVIGNGGALVVLKGENIFLFKESYFSLKMSDLISPALGLGF
ncbi:MAG: hypothetical protein WGN25_12825 [Candidatus Electrothrix sp. GW3-4]|uniref:hypothetical protein n=1 Tax=Candidatus Electrothrix sp. GW3-4 TaxID=3126740 RepID=UPI0030CBB557